MGENDDVNWDDFHKEMEADWQEIENLGRKIDEGFDWISIFINLEKKLEQFKSNMESMNQGISIFDNGNNLSGNFLTGIFLVGVVSAYESFIHDYFDVCCGNPLYISRALVNIEKLSDKDRHYLKLKNNSSKESLVNRLKKATLYDPVQISRIALDLFDLKMPTLGEKCTKKLLELRNIFTHHGGFRNGQPVEIELEYVKNVYDVILELINGYISAIQLHADRHFDGELQ